MKWQNKIRNFMYGRYGADELYNFLFGLYFIFLIINLFIKSPILSVLELLTIFTMFYRVFSKNITKRSKERRQYLKLKKQIFSPFSNIKRNITNKDYVYKKCHQCHKTLKLPLPDKRGIKHTKCPNCQKKITLFTLKKQKIEIIKNNS